jgi:hypothetical protein
LRLEQGGGSELQKLDTLRPRRISVGGVSGGEEAFARSDDPMAEVHFSCHHVVQAVDTVGVTGQGIVGAEAKPDETQTLKR